MSNKVKYVNIKNSAYYFFNDIINIEFLYIYIHIITFTRLNVNNFVFIYLFIYFPHHSDIHKMF